MKEGNEKSVLLQFKSTKLTKYYVCFISVVTLQIFRVFLYGVPYFRDINHAFWLRLLTQIVLAALAIVLLRKDLVADWKIFLSRFLKTLIIALIGYLSIMVVFLIAIPLFHSEMQAGDATANYVGQIAEVNPLVGIFENVCLAPFIEGLTFRTSLLKILNSLLKSKTLVVLLASFLFGLIHWDFSSASLFAPAQVFMIEIRSLVGIIICLVYIKSKNIYGSIFLHALANLI